MAATGPTRRRRRWALACALALTASLAACSSGSSTASAPGMDTAGGAAAPAAAEAADASRTGLTDAKAAPAAPGGQRAVPGIQQRVVRTAEVVIEVGDLPRSAARVRTLAEGLGGVVASESTTFAGTDLPPDEKPEDDAPAKRVAQPGQSVLVIRVPEPSMERALGQLTGAGGVGRELRRSSTAQDVTADLADLESRVATQRASVARVRALLERATSLSDIVKLEGEVSRREAELEAAQARRAALAGRAELATITVDLRTPDVEVVEQVEEDKSSFLTGLRSGWRAVVESTNVVLTVLGALLPIAVVAALVGLPLLALRRRSRAARRPVVVAAPPAPAASPFPPAPPAGQTSAAPADRPAD